MKLSMSCETTVLPVARSQSSFPRVIPFSRWNTQISQSCPTRYALIDAMYMTLAEPKTASNASFLTLKSAGRYGMACAMFITCLLYTSDAADERSSVDLGG